MRALPAVLVALALVLAAGAAAQPNPGTNGEIAFERGGTIQAFDPRVGTTRQVAQGTEPAWSPQGRIAYVRAETIYLAAADGTDERALTTGSWPAWSPDGGRLAFVRAQQLFALDVAQGTEIAVTGAGGDIVAPAWSPDGTRIAYGANGSIFTVALDGGDSVPVVTGGRASGGPAWSPDGTQLAFIGTNGQVFVTAPDGQRTKQLTFTLMGANGLPQRPAWSPDGTLVAWAQGPDICVADPTGKVARLTRTQDPAQPAASPDWQSTAWPAYQALPAPAGLHDAKSCDRRAGALVDILESNVSPQIVTVAAPAELVFVNHLDRSVVVTLDASRASVVAGGTYGFATKPGEFDFSVAGYADGVPRRGHVIASAAGSASIEQHAAIRFGDSTTLAGAAAGTAGGVVTISAKPYGATSFRRLATVKPVAGRWTLAVSPRITTLYAVSYEGARAERRLRVKPRLDVRHVGPNVLVRLGPARTLAGRPVYLFRLSGGEWVQSASARARTSGMVGFTGLRPGRYYVGYDGRADYWGTASEPFTIRG